MKHLKLILLLFTTFIICFSAKGSDITYNIRQISNRDGLSNSAVICLFQDKDRHLWIGTYDGLNKYDGTDIQIYKPDIKNPHSISGNVIRRIIESKNDFLWIMTKGGLNKYSKKKNKIEAYFNEFREDSSIACDNQGNFYILTPTGTLSFYDFDKNEFKEVDVQNLKPTKGWCSLMIDFNNKVWITNNGIIRQYMLKYSENNNIELEWIGNFDHPYRVTHIYYDKGTLLFVDQTGDLYFIESDEKEFIRNIRPAIAEYGNISAILFDGRDIVIGFDTNGVIKLNHKKEYEIEKLPINCGVFSLFKDDTQDILWVGTDGQGLYACAHDGYIFNGINLEELPLKSQRPVRAIFSDPYGDLWLGTKGNGIIRIKGYENTSEYSWQNVQHLSVQNGLSNNAVFTFEMSTKNNVLWIGSSGPELNYYSFDDKKIHTLKNNDPISFVEVHNIIETSDTILWVSSQFSMLKVKIRKIGNMIETLNVKQYLFDIKDKQLYNKIYSVYQENDSIMWLAMRGNGAIRFNNVNGNYQLTTFNTKDGIAPMNDILSIHMDKNHTLWFGSSYGISSYKSLIDGNFLYKNYNENDGLLNNTIHGILESDNGLLWLSSNMGIILFDPVNETFQNFNQKSGMKVIEFSDNAYFKDEKTSKLFFGGIDGIVWIVQGESKKNNFVPPISFNKLYILNEEVNMDDFLIKKHGKEYLQFKHNQNFFTLSFSTNDFAKGVDRKFSYMLENFNEVWMNTDSREAQFTNIPPGEYTLKVKYGNESNQESQIASLNIIILPPWYMSLYAKLFYTLLIISLIVFLFRYLTKRYENKKIEMTQQLDRKYKEEMYENKLRFFTNITHEFCTPLTLIHAPSEKLLNYKGSDEFIKKYAHIIKSNTERLNNLVQEIIDFRRMETGNKIVKIENCDINEICDEIMSTFTTLSEENNIKFGLDINDHITWNSDHNCIRTILNNLISNAFKYTPAGGSININIKIENEELVLKVYNTGKGIKEEDIPYIFNRYSVLDNIKENSIKGLSSRNGLGLAISKSMIDLLEGNIQVNSQFGEYAEFIVRFPSLEIEGIEILDSLNKEIFKSQSSTHLSLNNEPRHYDKIKSNENISQDSDGRPKILIVDDNEEIRWVLKDILEDDYFIITAKDGNEGFEQLTNNMPELVITDIMMPNQDGISMTKQIKINPYTMHIPIIVISVKSAIDDKIESIESGADAYISKPFDIQFLKTMVRQLIEKHKKLKEYYNSTASSFNYLNGQLLPKEDRDFIHTVVRTIDQNIGDIEFSPEDLAESLSISLRSLYRKFKDLGLLSPKDFIKKQRIEYSAKLLLSTNLTISEIMYSAGFATRSHFYKEFTRRYNQSPTEYREEKM